MSALLSRLISRWAAIALLIILTGCAAGPKFETQGVDPAITPQYAAAHIDTVRDHNVIWGGIILSCINLKDRTEIEVLSYPLDSAQRPDVNAQANGRFLIIKEEYLEAADYAPGRIISVSGALQNTRVGQVGEISYTYPVIQPQAIYLWRRDGLPASSVHFGIGVSISR
ncbi:MAG: Slp family lipoprotein [Gammaproteobacteria bacterium]|nr:Slp family lipoprotein [Gammaproteobacteria bacterium]